MGVFLDSFGLSSGMTLGSLATQSAFEFGGKALAHSVDAATAKFCAERYDPVVRADISHLMVLGRLEPAEYPFGDKEFGLSKRQRILLAVVAFLFLGPIIQKAWYWRSIRVLVSGPLTLFWVFVPWIALYFHRRYKKLNNPTGVDIKALKGYGQQYWHVREYVRQALDLGRFTPQEGLRKLCNTALVRRLPDSTDEIEANAFFFKQSLNQ